MSTSSLTHQQLMREFNIPVPRYTSYPTAPVWNQQSVNQKDWQSLLIKQFSDSNTEKGISLYVHLPYCEKLCLFCACNKRIIQKEEGLQKQYIEAVLQEWSMYLRSFSVPPCIKEIHLGGGTPTFFNPKYLKQLIDNLQKNNLFHNTFEFSFEAHPNSTTLEHLTTLYQLGFRRLSVGVQDFNHTVQHAINRVQSYETIERVTQQARSIGYQSINYDLIYGLPHQNTTGMLHNIQCLERLKPDRIALYSFAYVPWIAKNQNQIPVQTLLKNEEKQALYTCAKEQLAALGYVDIGMDHFALKTDTLYDALKNKTINRNFMGYNTWQTNVLIGLGVSAISDASQAYAQNTKNIDHYIQKMNNGQWAIEKTYVLSENDQRIKQAILSLLCQRELDLCLLNACKLTAEKNTELKRMETLGLVQFTTTKLRVTSKGLAFIRNICSVLDAYFTPKKNTQTFSRSI